MKIDGTDISMVRGDSDGATVSCEKGGSSRPFEAGDTVYFTVKKDAYQTAPVLQKAVTDFTDGKAVILIVPEDTKQLDFGTYKYDVQVTFASGRVKTIIPVSNFRVMEEITDE